MAHFARVEDGVVTQVLVVSDADEHRGQDFLANDLSLGGTWIKTSYNTFGNVHKTGGTPLHKNYAGIGYTFDEARDAFIPPKPFASWVLNEDTCLWDAPVPHPADGERYAWNEEDQEWVAVEPLA